MKHLDKIANIAIIAAVIVFLAVTVRANFGGHRLPLDPSTALIGTTVHLTGVQFPKDRNSLLLVVSTTCHFCKDSLPFYKQLTEKSRGRVNVVAVLPQPQAEAMKFLQDAGVKPDQIVNAGPDAVGARGTPTVLLIDGNGKVNHAWAGRLDEKGQESLLASLPST